MATCPATELGKARGQSPESKAECHHDGNHTTAEVCGPRSPPPPGTEQVKRLRCVNWQLHLTEGGGSRGMRAGKDAEAGVWGVMASGGPGSHTASARKGDVWEREWGRNPEQ